MAETNVRRIADNVGLNKDTVTRHLGRLREHGFVLHEEVRTDTSGRYETARYVLDPSACLERFTLTPLEPDAAPRDGGHSSSNRPDEADPCPRDPDTVPARPAVSYPVPRPEGSDAVPLRGPASGSVPVSDFTGHGGSGHLQEEHAVAEEQHTDGELLLRRLHELGLAEHRARSVLARHGPDRVCDALDVAIAEAPRNPPGWVLAALRDGWDLAERAAVARSRREAQRRTRDQAVEEQARRERAESEERNEQLRSERWAVAVSAALDDRHLMDIVSHVMRTLPALTHHSVRIARARLLAWAAAIHNAQPDLLLHESLQQALTSSSATRLLEGPLPEPPAVTANHVTPLNQRLAACLDAATTAPRPFTSRGAP